MHFKVFRCRLQSLCPFYLLPSHFGWRFQEDLLCFRFGLKVVTQRDVILQVIGNFQLSQLVRNGQHLHQTFLRVLIHAVLRHQKLFTTQNVQRISQQHVQGLFLQLFLGISRQHAQGIPQQHAQEISQQYAQVLSQRHFRLPSPQHAQLTSPHHAQLPSLQHVQLPSPQHAQLPSLQQVLLPFQQHFQVLSQPQELSLLHVLLSLELAQLLSQ